LLGNRNVTEFNYRIADQSEAHIFVGIGTQKAADSTAIAKHFRKAKFATIDLTHDELAKSHLRHMVGGRSSLAEDELLYRFEFPERPGALMKFLTSMAPNWNISLFHYRNHGADYGRILIGIQVPQNEQKQFQKFLATLGYPHWNETDNPAYRLFLK
jgi:threonine dehydratase